MSKGKQCLRFSSNSWFWVQGNVEDCIGDQSGFVIEHKEVRYQLITPLALGKEEDRVQAFLLESTPTNVTLLGRVKLPYSRLDAWANKLLAHKLSDGIETEMIHDAKVADPDNVRMADKVISQVEEVADKSLHKVYNSHESFLWDLFSGMPWDSVGRDQALDWILSPEGGRPRLENASAKIEARGGPSYLELFEATKRSDSSPLPAAWKTRL